jgi:SAM-dependent methyltransferase
MEGKFDMVVCLLGTLSHMLDNKQAAAAFRQAARHLRPGGLLLLELAHPGADSTPTPDADHVSRHTDRTRRTDTIARVWVPTRRTNPTLQLRSALSWPYFGLQYIPPPLRTCDNVVLPCAPVCVKAIS